MEERKLEEINVQHNELNVAGNSNKVQNSRNNIEQIVTRVLKDESDRIIAMKVDAEIKFQNCKELLNESEETRKLQVENLQQVQNQLQHVKALYFTEMKNRVDLIESVDNTRSMCTVLQEYLNEMTETYVRIKTDKEQLDKQFDAQNAKVCELEAEYCKSKKSLEEQLKNTTASFEMLQNEFVLIQSQKCDYEKRNETMIVQMQEMNSAYNDLEDKFKESCATNLKLSIQIEEQKQICIEIDKLNNDIDRNKQEIEDLHNTCDELTEKNNGLRADLLRNTDLLSESVLKIDEYKKKLAENIETNALMVQKYEQQIQEKQCIENNLIEEKRCIDEELDNLKRKYADLETTISANRSIIEENEIMASRYAESNENLKKRVQELESELETRTNTNNSNNLETEMAINELKEKYMSLTEENKRLNESHKIEMDTLNKSMESLKADNSKLKCEREELREINNLIDKEYRESKEQNEKSAHMKYEELSTAFEAYKKTAVKWHDDEQKHKQAASKLKKEIDNVQKKSKNAEEKLKAKVKALNDTIQELEERIETMKVDAENRIKELSQTNEKLTQTMGKQDSTQEITDSESLKTPETQQDSAGFLNDKVIRDAIEAAKNKVSQYESDSSSVASFALDRVGLFNRGDRTPLPLKRKLLSAIDGGAKQSPGSPSGTQANVCDSTQRLGANQVNRRYFRVARNVVTNSRLSGLRAAKSPKTKKDVYDFSDGC